MYVQFLAQFYHFERNTFLSNLSVCSRLHYTIKYTVSYTIIHIRILYPYPIWALLHINKDQKKALFCLCSFFQIRNGKH